MYLLSFAEADSYCFCMYLSPRLFILSIHLEQAMAETTKKNHRRARPLTRRTLQGCWGAWPAWWGVNKQNTLCFQFPSNPRASALGWGMGTRFESYIACYVAHSNDYVMYYIDFPNSYITCHTTWYITTYTCYIWPLLHSRFLFSYIMCYIPRYILVVNCVCKMFYCYTTFSLTWYITCYICCSVLLRTTWQRWYVLYVI